MFAPRLLADGRVCCSTINSRGERVAPIYPCDACAAHVAQDAYAPPDPYARDLAQLRAAEAIRVTPEAAFEAAWKVARQRLFDREYQRTR